MYSVVKRSNSNGTSENSYNPEHSTTVLVSLSNSTLRRLPLKKLNTVQLFINIF